MSNISWTTRSLRFAQDTPKYLWRRYRNLRPLGQAFIWCTIAFYIALSTFIIMVTPAKIFQWLYDLAQRLSHLRLGWLALGGIIVLVCFPPFVGHTTAITLCGYAYGMKGFGIAAIGSSVGSALVFLTFRLLFSRRLRHWSAANKKWQALESVIRAKGLPLIILIRMSPIPPWMWSNIFFSSIESVALWQFVIATLFIYPKVLLHVFIGSLAAPLSDGEQRGHMDTKTKILDSALIVAGILIAIASSWLVYRFMQKHIRQLEEFPEETDRLAADVIEDVEEGAPLLRDFSDDSVDDMETERARSPRSL
ncbi:hypothetical protein PILCRDRAFT_94434 [Piloderma croceum F 1598]|uniref:Golgi apparatus membrane protein TVP38 n=1 Tax=Piloderma croceum (strain F 1598) TaxID=765440 RepID=A0A0C3G351_PILCF|nr:hypothetical protein PILCRDRAFT_94434 [Piloderma croceum F 1598]